MFEWDEANTEHIARHGFSVSAEAEQALSDPGRVVYPTSDPTEHRRAAVGRTLDGRILLVVYTVRNRQVRVVTARDTTDRERRRYRRRSRR
ncbi:MAG: BrnT family toxin [Dehalococcoidia bacterium]|nr:BrnT family toxin [Dehalococcoidia bacterium]